MGMGRPGRGAGRPGTTRPATTFRSWQPPTQCGNRRARSSHQNGRARTPRTGLPPVRAGRRTRANIAGCSDQAHCGDPPAHTWCRSLGFQNSAAGPDLGFYAARSYSLMRPPRTGRRLVRSWGEVRDRVVDRGMPPRTPGPHPRLEPGPSATDPERLRNPPQSAPAAPLPERRSAAETATRAGRPRPVPHPKTGSRRWHDQRISPGGMTWTRLSARTGAGRRGQ